MRLRALVFGLVLIAGSSLGIAVWLTQEHWRPWRAASGTPAPSTPAEPGEHEHDHGDKDRVKLTSQAKANLGLIVKPVALQKEYWRTILVPGQVVEQRGRSDRTVTTPIAGIVERIAALPGDEVRPGDELFTLRLNSESLQSTQTELYKTGQEVKIAQKQLKIIEGSVRSGALAEQRLLDLQYQLDRLAAALKAYRADLAARGLTPEQIDQAEEGTFLRQLVIRVPSDKGNASEETTYEVEELTVQPGQQVQGGEVLSHLADHSRLYIEGRGFKEDAPLVEETVARNWPVTVEFAEETGGPWKPLEKAFSIAYVAPSIDADSSTFPFYLPLVNQSRTYTRDGRTFRFWAYRPGQRARLRLRVGRFENVFVLPAAAVVREGPEVYVFRQNGQVFDRIPVHLRYEDHSNVVLESEGSVSEGDYLAHNAAMALNRALQASKVSGSHDPHAGHSHDH